MFLRRNQFHLTHIELHYAKHEHSLDQAALGGPGDPGCYKYLGTGGRPGDAAQADRAPTTASRKSIDPRRTALGIQSHSPIHQPTPTNQGTEEVENDGKYNIEEWSPKRPGLPLDESQWLEHVLPQRRLLGRDCGSIPRCYENLDRRRRTME